MKLFFAKNSRITWSGDLSQVLFSALPGPNVKYKERKKLSPKRKVRHVRNYLVEPCFIFSDVILSTVNGGLIKIGND